jgi:CRP-like cAMP-binding protein
MSNASQHQDVSVLSAARNGLVYLTPNDWALIVDKAARMQFKAGETIVHKGKRTQGVYLVLKGTAAVQIPSHAGSLGVGVGDVCGEISFLDELPATADVVAKEAVEAFYLDRPTLQSLFELFPHLGSRFYHSLAAILSRRVRELIAPALPQVPAAVAKKK